MKTVLILGCISGVVFLCSGLVSRYRVEKAWQIFFYEEDMEGFNIIKANYQSVQYTKDFVFKYAKALYLKEYYEECIPVLKRAIELYPTTDKYVDLGNCYQSIGYLEEAESCFTYASQMLPHLVYPSYRLFILYKESGQFQEARRVAEHIVAMTPKRATPLVLEIKKMAKSYLDNHI